MKHVITVRMKIRMKIRMKACMKVRMKVRQPMCVLGTASVNT
jgi:hypothetical protein